MASIQCRCGSVAIKLASCSPKSDLECCCVDCCSKNVWSCEAGGVPPPKGFGTHGVDLPMHLVYFDNDLDVQRGREKIAFNRLREGAQSTNMIASCCKSLLCVDHPSYRGNSVLLLPDFCPLAGAPPLPRPACRVFVKDWPAEAYALLPPKPGVWFDQDGAHGESEDVALAEERIVKLKATMLGGGGETFQQLLDAAGGAVETLGLPEGANSRRKRAEEARAKRTEGVHGALAQSLQPGNPGVE